MIRRRWLQVVCGGALVALTGCGAGDGGAFDAFFGGGSGPSSVFTQPNYGRLVGVVVQRASDQRIVILGSGAAGQGQTAVAGARVAMATLGAAAVTDAAGAYAIERVPAGDYDVTLTLPAGLGGSTSTFRVRVTAGQTLEGLPPIP
jgi:hypothetical protein